MIYTGSILCILCALVISTECIPELKLIHIVFAHKTYAPITELLDDNDIIFPSNLTYEYFNSAAYSIPQSGRLNMYNLGVYLRKTYGRFLGEIYTSEVMKMRTTEHALSMLSGQLVNAGLWPPAEIQKWSTDMDWQPIPTDYEPMQMDTLLLGMHCPSYRYEMRKVLNTKRVQDRMSHHVPLFDYISHYTGMRINQPSQVALLYAALETKADFNKSLPYWASEIFPHGGMYNLSLFEYDLLSQTPLQKKLNGGTMIKEVIGNSLKYIRGTIPKERKLMMYSGNERNIVGVLKALNLWSPHMLNEATSIIFEMYADNDTQTHGIKVIYYTGVDGDSIPLRLPYCTEICPLKTFLSLLFDVIPQNEYLLCNEKIMNLMDKDMFLDSRATSHSRLYKPKKIVILFLLIIVSFMY